MAMRFAAIADVHGNAAALEAVLADIRSIGIETIVNLGDHLSGPLEAARTADLLMSLDLPSVRGNHDRSLAEADLAGFGLSDKAAYAQLSARHLAWLRRQPTTLVFRNGVFLCHGTPASDETYWLEHVGVGGAVSLASLDHIEAAARGIEQSLMLCGHSHSPRAVRLSDGRLIVNPGSIGLPAYSDDMPIPHRMQVGSPDARYAILEKGPAGWTVSHRCVPYDHLAMARMAESGGRRDWASALATGWV
jgi:putative phosphoesterase